MYKDTYITKRYVLPELLSSIGTNYGLKIDYLDSKVSNKSDTNLL
jgi:hypothetical protein